ncbi:Putative protein in type-1 retrotransposable element R1DM [Araneus ventricosus]|uniref:Reverse transcriptase domain-containing protein n=1 Tax=Araneus ventricosus TaxID=182803 RepID=A0A4Y2LBA5_ARAVE|nr:Putative protein in type-1 retrotransposable element R1DM [Araneus ventricosus]
MRVFAKNNVVGVITKIRGKSVLVVSVYSPPKEDFRTTLSELDNCLTLPHDRIIICGDFNAKSPVWGGQEEDERGRQLLEFILARSLVVLNDDGSLPIFDGHQGNSWIDVSICDPLLFDNVSKWKVDLEPTGSDHKSVSFSLYTGKKPSIKTPRFTLEQLDPLLFNSHLSSAISGLKFNRFHSLDSTLDQYVTAIQGACRKSIIVKTAVRKKQRWWTKQLEILRSDVRRAKRKLYKARGAQDRAFLRPRLKQAEAPNKAHFQLNSVRKEDGSLTSTIEEALTELLRYHFPDDVSQDSPAQADIRRNSRVPPNTSDDSPFSQLEVETAVGEIKSKKAPGPDGLYGDVVKAAFAMNPKFLVDLFNCCLERGYFPKRWRTAQLVLFNKPKKDDTDPSAFRPICMLDALGKVLDKLVTKRLYFHLLSHQHLHGMQFEFMPGKSATDAVLELKSWIHTARAEEKHSVIISLDIQSAFSRVWWPLVLRNLHQMDCPKNIFRMVASFLEDRSVSFSYGEEVSTKPYSIGCPQGSNSGPLLWLLIANDALHLTFEDDVKILAYADDFYLFVAASGKHTIQKKVRTALSTLEQWSQGAKVQFAHSKTELIPFGKKGRMKHPPYCSFSGKAIKLNRCMRVLGVILDDGLNGMAHINHVGDRMSRILNRLTIAKTRRGLSGRVLKVLYKRALERLLVYSVPAWWTGTVRQVAKLTSIQRKALLAVTGAFRTTSTIALQVTSGIEPIDLVCEKEQAMYWAKHRAPVVSFLGVGLGNPNLDLYHETWQHPGGIPAVSWDRDSRRHIPAIYTDGSKIDGQVGAAFCITSADTSGEYQFRLQDHCSVFQAELVAIQQALQWKRANSPTDN